MQGSCSMQSSLLGRPLGKQYQHVAQASCRAMQRRHRIRTRAVYQEGTDITATARQKVRGAGESAQASSTKGPVSDFVRKVKAAWAIFFPPQAKSISPKEEGKNRLRMILVADRCGMNPSSLYEMRHSIVQAVSDYVDIEAEELVEVNISTDADLGTVYSVAVPIKRVKPVARVPMSDDIDMDGITLRWDAEDKESDPSDQFPFGC